MKELLEGILKNLNTTFLSEADFQFTLAWKISEALKKKGADKGEVILECPGEQNGKRVYYDIFVKDEAGKTHLIELKYRTKKATVERNGKSFTLKNQSAHDLGRYHFIEDIERLETQKITTDYCYCIMLTNDKSYWIEPPPDRKAPQDIEFRIHKEITPGDHKWGKGDKTYRGRDNAKINIIGKYECKWRPYECNSVKDKPNGEFRYLLLEIPPENKA